MVSTAGESQLAELIELAGLLRDLRHVPGLDKVVVALKGPYRSTHFQLRLASVLLASGAEIEQLEPASEGGRNADIAFRYADSSFAVECLRPAAASADTYDERIRLAHQVLDRIKQHDTVLSVAIALNEEPSPAVRREVTRVVHRLALDVVSRSQGTNDFPTVLAHGPAGVISVSRALSVPAGSPPRWLAAPGFPIAPHTKPNLFVRFSAARAVEMIGIDAEFQTGSGLSHVALWLESDKEEFVAAEIDLEPPLMRLARKLERKLAQTRSAERRHRILAAETWLASQVHRAESSVISRVRGKLVDAHDTVAGVLLLQSRNAVSDPRDRQVVAYIAPSSRSGLPKPLLDALEGTVGVRVVRLGTS